MSRLQTLKPRLGAASLSRVPVMQPGSWRTSGQSSAARGYDHKWRKARLKHLEQHPFCVFCMRDAGINGVDRAAVILECALRGIAVPYANIVDHMDAHRGNQDVFWDRSRWQSLCTTHHSGEKQRMESGGA